MIRRVGNTEILPVHRASCHCSAVVLELDLPDGIVNPRRCNCSICRRKGAIAATVPLSGLRIVGYNVGCLEGVDPLDIPSVPTTDGVNHSSDRRA